MKYNVAFMTKVDGGQEQPKLLSCLWDTDEFAYVLAAFSVGISILDRSIKQRIQKWDLEQIFSELKLNRNGTIFSGEVPPYEQKGQWIKINILEAYICDNYVIESYTGVPVGVFEWDKTPFATELIEIIAFPIL